LQLRGREGIGKFKRTAQEAQQTENSLRRSWKTTYGKGENFHHLISKVDIIRSSRMLSKCKRSLNLKVSTLAELCHLGKEPSSVRPASLSLFMYLLRVFLAYSSTSAMCLILCPLCKRRTSSQLSMIVILLYPVIPSMS